jgi:hypothetical protein
MTALKERWLSPLAHIAIKTFGKAGGFEDLLVENQAPSAHLPAASRKTLALPEGLEPSLIHLQPAV